MSTSLPSRKLAVLQLVHERWEYLGTIWQQAFSLAEDVTLQIVLDRPNARVVQEVQSIADRPGVQILEAPFAVLRPGYPERFMEMREFQLQALPARDYDYVVIWDDDHFLEDVAEARAVLHEDWDIVYATKIYFWDSPETFNSALPVHRSAFFFRYTPHDHFVPTRILNAPVMISDNARNVKDLDGKLLDFGYLYGHDRERVWAAYKASGKIDALTLQLLKPPKLETYRK